MAVLERDEFQPHFELHRYSPQQTHDIENSDDCTVSASGNPPNDRLPPLSKPALVKIAANYPTNHNPIPTELRKAHLKNNLQTAAMVLLSSSQSYVNESSLLISAAPTTTRITTHYSLPRIKSKKSSSPKSEQTTTTANGGNASDAPAPTPIAVLTLKTYDPVSGVVLKYRTNRAAEVGRLMAALGRLGTVMASGKALAEEKDADAVPVPGSGAKEDGDEETTAVVNGAAPVVNLRALQQSQQSQQGGKKGKKKGKK